jgi:hypothetical protein
MNATENVETKNTNLQPGTEEGQLVLIQTSAQTFGRQLTLLAVVANDNILPCDRQIQLAADSNSVVLNSHSPNRAVWFCHARLRGITEGRLKFYPDNYVKWTAACRGAMRVEFDLGAYKGTLRMESSTARKGVVVFPEVKEVPPVPVFQGGIDIHASDLAIAICAALTTTASQTTTCGILIEADDGGITITGRTRGRLGHFRCSAQRGTTLFQGVVTVEEAKLLLQFLVGLGRITVAEENGCLLIQAAGAYYRCRMLAPDFGAYPGWFPTDPSGCLVANRRDVARELRPVLATVGPELEYAVEVESRDGTLCFRTAVGTARETFASCKVTNVADFGPLYVNAKDLLEAIKLIPDEEIRLAATEDSLGVLCSFGGWRLTTLKNIKLIRK